MTLVSYPAGSNVGEKVGDDVMVGAFVIVGNKVGKNDTVGNAVGVVLGGYDVVGRVDTVG
jgi:acyl-[acyl carrier protein]--UDP-N-acetylglucosamine O-acyltransferase